MPNWKLLTNGTGLQMYRLSITEYLKKKKMKRNKKRRKKKTKKKKHHRRLSSSGPEWNVAHKKKIFQKSYQLLLGHPQCVNPYPSMNMWVPGPGSHEQLQLAGTWQRPGCIGLKTKKNLEPSQAPKPSLSFCLSVCVSSSNVYFQSLVQSLNCFVFFHRSWYLCQYTVHWKQRNSRGHAKTIGKVSSYITWDVNRQTFVTVGTLDWFLF